MQIKYRWKEDFQNYPWYQQNKAEDYLDSGSKERLRWELWAGEQDPDSEAEAYYADAD